MSLVIFEDQIENVQSFLPSSFSRFCCSTELPHAFLRLHNLEFTKNKLSKIIIVAYLKLLSPIYFFVSNYVLLCIVQIKKSCACSADDRAPTAPSMFSPKSSRGISSRIAWDIRSQQQPAAASAGQLKNSWFFVDSTWTALGQQWPAQKQLGQL